MSGFSQLASVSPPTLESTVNKGVARPEDIQAFKATLPDTKEILRSLENLSFFAICPNGKRIPVQEICAEYARDPEGLVLRTFDDRLVVVVQAVFPDKETPYWQQAFYLSTGTSSGMAGTWLPFDGVLVQTNVQRLLVKGWADVIERVGDDKILMGTGWFSKDTFCAPTARMFPNLSRNLDSSKRRVIRSTYGKLLLPEGDYMYVGSSFDRFGTPSYVLASHALGGKEFIRPEGEEFFPTYRFSDQTSVEGLKRILDNPSPPQPCFTEIAASYPISKPFEVNNYIDEHHALSYMNGFREFNLFPPGLAFANTPMKSLGYSLPVQTYWEALHFRSVELWTQYKMGNITIDEVRRVFENPKEELKKYQVASREECVFPDEPDFQFNINRSRYAAAPKMLEYYGGARKKRVGKTIKKSKKSKQTKRRRQTKRR